jgi:hypothetical protein
MSFSSLRRLVSVPVNFNSRINLYRSITSSSYSSTLNRCLISNSLVSSSRRHKLFYTSSPPSIALRSLFPRLFSSPPDSSSPPSDVSLPSLSLVYENPFASPLKRLKIFSVSSSCIALISSPFLLILNQGSLLAGMAIVSVTLFTSLASTSIIYIFSRSQAMKIYQLQEQTNEEETNEESFIPEGLVELPQFNHQEYCIELQTLFGRKRFVTVHKESLDIKTLLASNCSAFRSDEQAGQEIPLYIHPAGVIDQNLKEKLKIESVEEEQNNSQGNEQMKENEEVKQNQTENEKEKEKEKTNQ